MYGFPKDLELGDIAGSEIQQICLGRSDVQFRFSTERAICAQALVEIFWDEELVSVWTQDGNWSNVNFQMLLGVAVDNYAVLHERLLEIRFKDGLSCICTIPLPSSKAFKFTLK